MNGWSAERHCSICSKYSRLNFSDWANWVSQLRRFQNALTSALRAGGFSIITVSKDGRWPWAKAFARSQEQIGLENSHSIVILWLFYWPFRRQIKAKTSPERNPFS